MKNILYQKCQEAKKELFPFVFEKNPLSDLLLISLFIKGHILIEDLPGVGKTTLAKAFSKILGLDFSRIQGTSDMLPQDISGGEIIDTKTREFCLRKGPLFKELILVDEINRMHPKSQSVFLQAMEEKSVSINGENISLPEIHMILATQNPIEYSGTYPLPEAQRDRFSCSVTIGFPSKEVQKNILKNQNYLYLDNKIDSLKTVFSKVEILEIQKGIESIEVADEILERLIKLASWTRDESFFRYGISPRGLAIFVQALKAKALLESRAYVIPEDGMGILGPFLVHRIEHKDLSLSKQALSEMLLEKYKEIFSIEYKLFSSTE
ncbi:MoxR family ATPase [Candidatus Peregrinibacteria bacterium]|jgi:MoxR-like ATPase|nr:MoxR family ATPase [Candidatus Peregrinibacteria bacterium]